MINVRTRGYVLKKSNSKGHKEIQEIYNLISKASLKDMANLYLHVSNREDVYWDIAWKLFNEKKNIQITRNDFIEKILLKLSILSRKNSCSLVKRILRPELHSKYQ